MVAAGVLDASSETPADLPPFKCGHYGHISKRTKRLCRGMVVTGTQHCLSHAGKALEQHRAEGQIRIEIAKWQLSGHDGSDIDPRVEILRLIAFWKWKADMYGRLLAEAYQAAEELRAMHQAGELLLAEEQTETRYRDGEYAGEIPEHPDLATARHSLERVFTTGGVAALVGYKFDADRDGRIYAASEEVRALVKLEKEANELVGKFSALAVQAKVAEHRIELAQQVGLMIQAVILGVLRDLEVSAMDRRVQDLIAFHIDQVTATPALAA